MPVSQTPNRPTSSITSLADAVSAIEADARLEPAQRKTFLGAIRTICAVLGQPANTVPATMADVDRLLGGIPTPVLGRSRKTIANTRSRVKAALLHVTAAPARPPYGMPLSAEWAALLATVTDPRLQKGLSGLVRYASFHGVAPHGVDDAFLHKVLASIGATSIGRDTRRSWRLWATLWNEAIETVPGWPTQRLTAPPPVERQRQLTLEELPASFRQDLDAYLYWAAGSDRLADDAPTTPLKPSTQRQRREHLRLAASTLAAALGEPQQVERLATLVVPANLRTILSAYLATTTDHQPTAFIRGLAITLLAVARHWVKVPAAQLAELKRLNAKLGSTPTGLTTKNRDLVRQFEDRELLAALLNLPDKLHQQVRTSRMSPARRLQRMQIALAIELLLTAPMRMQNLVALEIGRSLQWPSGRNAPAFVVLRRGETKNEVPLDYPLSEHCMALLNEYLDRYRSYAAAGERQWLFKRLDGSPVTDAALRDGISKAVKRTLGVDMTPHQFRHVAAAVALDVHPGAIGLVRDLLGHKSIKTTANFYAGLRTREAAREYDRILERGRKPDKRKG